MVSLIPGKPAWKFIKKWPRSGDIPQFWDFDF
jgi:hypothetical protein